MYVVNEDGSAAVNLEQVKVIGFGTNNATAETVLLALLEPEWQVALASGGDRPKRAVEEIMRAYRSGKRLIDLNDLLGDRPSLTIPAPGTILHPGNGEGRP
jgi:hypothetical protein